MAMIKRANGQIEEFVDANTKTDEKQVKLAWSDDIVIKDVLEVPTTSPTSLDVDLDEQDEDEIAVRV